MNKQKEFSNPMVIKSLKTELTKAIKPLVAKQVKQRNAVRDEHNTLLARIETLNVRQGTLTAELAELRTQGAQNIMDNKEVLRISVKINDREAEAREGQNWLTEFIPQAQNLETKLVQEERELLEVMRRAIETVHQAKAVEMNNLLHQASCLRHSFFLAVMETIDEVGEKKHLSASLTAPNRTYGLKIDRQRSWFTSPGRG